MLHTTLKLNSISINSLTAIIIFNYKINHLLFNNHKSNKLIITEANNREIHKSLIKCSLDIPTSTYTVVSKRNCITGQLLKKLDTFTELGARIAQSV
jgi:hypothetical protein